MIQPTRTNLLLLKERLRSVAASVSILQARRQALVREVLQLARPFLAARAALGSKLAEARAALEIALRREGEAAVASIAAVNAGRIAVEVIEENLLGITTLRAEALTAITRTPPERSHDWLVTTPSLEEAIQGFEESIAAVIRGTEQENRLKVLGREISRVTRRSKVLEERIQPRIAADIQTIAHYLGERDRENHFRLKRFKAMRDRPY